MTVMKARFNVNDDIYFQYYAIIEEYFCVYILVVIGKILMGLVTFKCYAACACIDRKRNFNACLSTCNMFFREASCPILPRLG